MVKYAVAMANAGQATWWNLGFQFVRLYYFLFSRITHGASRLQEVLADRMAAFQYGPEAFEAGLRHAIRRSVEFSKLANREIRNAVEAGRPICDVYALVPPPGMSFDADVEKELNQPTTEDDTHPSAADRFRLVRNITRKQTVLADDTLVWDLFVDKDALTREMNETIAQAVSQ
jgi:Zn-dependent protease with chaperone function